MMRLSVDGENYNISNLVVERESHDCKNVSRTKITRSQPQRYFIEQRKIKSRCKFVEDHISLCSSHSSSSKQSSHREYHRPEIQHLCSRIGIDVRTNRNVSNIRKSSRSLTRRPSDGCLRVEDGAGKHFRETGVRKNNICRVSSEEGSYSGLIGNERSNQGKQFTNSVTNIYQMARRKSRDKRPSNSRIQKGQTKREDGGMKRQQPQQPKRRKTEVVSQTSHYRSEHAINDDSIAMNRENQPPKPQHVPLETETFYCKSRNDHTIRDNTISLQHQYQPPPMQHTSTEKQYLEVSPGVIMEVRQADETSRAVQGGYASISSCLCCQVKLGCVPDAIVVICPDCRVLTPNFSDDQSPSRPLENQERYGIGLGQKMLMQI